jgi:hypothetical protein
MAISAQDKIMHVANKLGLSSLKYMQASTGAVYDGINASSGSFDFFSEASQHTNPAVTNINDNRFEVNEALLVETIGFYTFVGQGSVGAQNLNSGSGIESNKVIVFDLIIGNKTVMKNTPIFVAGGPGTFASSATQKISQGPDLPRINLNRHQVYMEGAGILIPPQVEYQVKAKIYDLNTGAVADDILGCYLYGTRVLLNFNTSI